MFLNVLLDVNMSQKIQMKRLAPLPVCEEVTNIKHLNTI